MSSFAVRFVITSIRRRVKTLTDIAFNLIELSELRTVITKIRLKDVFSFLPTFFVSPLRLLRADITCSETLDRQTEHPLYHLAVELP